MAVYSQQPTMCWAPCHHGVCPQWWRPRQTAGKLSPAPCTALAPYSWPCGFLVIHQGKPWRHHVELMSCKTRINSYLDSHLVATGFAAFDRIWIYWILVYSYLLNSINFIAIHSILLMPCWPMVADLMWVGKYDAYTGWTWDYAWYCMNLYDMHDRIGSIDVEVDAWLCILSSPPCVGHLVIMVYVHSGGVLDRLLASWVLLLARHWLHIPGPVDFLWSTRANHGGIMLVRLCFWSGTGHKDRYRWGQKVSASLMSPWCAE